MDLLAPEASASAVVDGLVLFAALSFAVVGLSRGLARTASGMFAWGAALLTALWFWTALEAPFSAVVGPPALASALAAALPFALVAGAAAATRRPLRTWARRLPGAVDGAAGAALGLALGVALASVGWAAARASLGEGAESLGRGARTLPLVSLLAAPSEDPMERLLGGVLAAAASAPLDPRAEGSPEAESLRRTERELRRLVERVAGADVGQLRALGLDRVAELDVEALEQVQALNGFKGLEGIDETPGFERLVGLDDLGRVVDADDLRRLRDDAVELLHALQESGSLPALPGQDSLPPLEDFGDPERLREIFAEIDAGAEHGADLIPEFDPDDGETLLPEIGSRFFLEGQTPIVVPEREDLPEVQHRGARDFMLHLHESAVRLEERRRRIEAEAGAEPQGSTR